MLAGGIRQYELVVSDRAGKFISGARPIQVLEDAPIDPFSKIPLIELTEDVLAMIENNYFIT
jgi:hypothetical protein